jgi:hypothetical protein
MEQKVCGAQFEEHSCELEQGHRGKHRSGGVSWSDAGARRVEQERPVKSGSEIDCGTFSVSTGLSR